MRDRIRGFASAALFAAASTVLSFSVAAQQVPPEIQPPAGEHLLFQVHAKGDQIYSCKGDGAQFTWTLKAPDAQLFDKDGRPFGKHFAGPSWEAKDGSRVTGKARPNPPSPDPDSIPWLLITIISHDGNGVLSPATSIQRLNTKGGKAPASGCDASHVGQEYRAAYEADYLFYAPMVSQENPLSTWNKLAYARVKDMLMKSAEKMPEENYSFKPVDTVRSYGQIVGHVADAQYLFCSIALGEKNPAPDIEHTKTSKANLIAALNTAFAYCDKAYDGMTDATAVQTIKLFGNNAPRLSALTVNNMHDLEHYGNLATYMRMKNIVPPSSEQQQAPAQPAKK